MRGEKAHTGEGSADQAAQIKMTFLLLTGAGFSRNWGGWLASEAFEYLLGCPEIDDSLRQRLWDSKKQGGGFEDALAQLQTDAPTEKPRQVLQDAILRMFGCMNKEFTKVTFEPRHTRTDLLTTQDANYLVGSFLQVFKAIFTLNQDLLLEHHYLCTDNPPLQGPHFKSRRPSKSYIPGMKSYGMKPHDPSAARVADLTPDGPPFNEQLNAQPYFKLHGSTNWIGGEGESERLLIMGGNKSVQINQYPVLTWYHRMFRKYLSCPNARLMVIGYSFSDSYINDAIMQAANKDGLRIFIIDPCGVDVLSKVPGPLMESLNRCIIGASRRLLTETFGRDCVEHGKIMRFFSESDAR